MSEFQDWELYNTLYIDEDGMTEVVVRKWDSGESFNARQFLAEVTVELDKLDPKAAADAELHFWTATDQEGCPSHHIRFAYPRPATERELRLDRAVKVKSVASDRAWLQQRLRSLLEEASGIGMRPEDIGIGVSDKGYYLLETED